ncbi:response regulator transcription factor [Variovorax sp. J22R133]|uniref:response regulator transcription factor n=1 Tax=Variovorax brevis TaxID=3053503 RepID=UPI0025782A82|nr:response regulator transcription factor [Variovorax sp. J22R133]MDM0111523.1 response regulator transcription factor [Variovorax sp. J22R133]
MRIAILEDDEAQAAFLAHTLEQRLTPGDSALSLVSFTNGTDLQRVLRNETFDLLVLDWTVPGLHGIELLGWLRVWQKNFVPVLMLSARGAEHEIAQALDLGADDYIVKPFRPNELRARIQRLLARQQPASTTDCERFGRWEFHRLTLQVLIHPEQAGDAPPERHTLTDREFRLALSLFRNKGRILSRAHLLESGDCRGKNLSSRALDSQIYRLRSKLGLHAERGLQLQTIYGHGYRLETAQTEAD